MTEKKVTTEDRRQGRPTREQAVAIAESVLVGARRAFCEQGYVAASMDDIADAIGVSKLTIYRRYPSKEALLYAVVDRDLEMLSTVLGNLAPHDDCPLDALREAARLLFDFSIAPANVRFASLLIAESAYNDQLRKRFAAWERLTLASMFQRIEAGQAAGALRLDDPHLIGTLLVDLIGGIANRLRAGSLQHFDADQADRLFDQRWQFFLRAAATRPPEA